MSSFNISNIKIKGRVILAPMAGITSFSYRKFMKPFGCALTYTEMISDCAMIEKNKETRKLLATDGKKDKLLALQLFGGKKETLIKALKIIENENYKYDFIDLNLACPVKKVITNNGGSSWLKDQKELYEMVSSIVKASKKPVLCKIRLGFDSINVEDTVKTLEKAGCSFIAIHARTRKELYTGKAHYDALKNIRKIIKIPFAISGDIFTVDDAITALKITKADAVMVARGGIGNPLLIKNINRAIKMGSKYKKEYFSDQRDFYKQIKFAKKYATYMYQEFNEIEATRVMRGILPKFFDNVPFAKNIKKEIVLCNTMDEVFKCFSKNKKEYKKLIKNKL